MRKLCPHYVQPLAQSNHPILMGSDRAHIHHHDRKKRLGEHEKKKRAVVCVLAGKARAGNEILKMAQPQPKPQQQQQLGGTRWAFKRPPNTPTHTAARLVTIDTVTRLKIVVKIMDLLGAWNTGNPRRNEDQTKAESSEGVRRRARESGAKAGRHQAGREGDRAASTRELATILNLGAFPPRSFATGRQYAVVVFASCLASRCP
ncbi:ADP-ribosylation factor binding protein 3-like protein [Anopheles sinensis]|uniref:ADP-ribosylation factor binding protein 3-like protein n=1 Tax=Anopheles sinensis TaxID=74873 RepID=A0A084VKH2_ANOSI|nr:ADP-ribosylation factor binding protein 3-like protein [Anopheles sinensis]